MPLLSYTLSVLELPHLIALSSAMMVAIAPSIFSVDFSLSALIFPAESVLINILSIFYLRTGFPLWAIFCSSVNFISSFVGGDIFLNPCPKGTTVNPIDFTQDFLEFTTLGFTFILSFNGCLLNVLVQFFQFFFKDLSECKQLL